jgi:hypothetical protein
MPTAQEQRRRYTGEPLSSLVEFKRLVENGNATTTGTEEEPIVNDPDMIAEYSEAKWWGG